MPWFPKGHFSYFCAVAVAATALAACGDGDTTTQPGGLVGENLGRLNPPGFVQGEALATGGAKITWFDSNAFEDGYIVQRRLPDTLAWATVGFFPANASGATDREAADRATYFYRVVAFHVTDTAASTEIRITIKDRTPPQTELLFTPPELTRSKEATFIYRSSEGASTFICELDGALRPCNSSLGCLESDPNCIGELKLANLADGEHNFTVRAVDSVGNEDPTATGWLWTVDTTPPALTITQRPDPVVGGPTGNAVTIAWTIDEPDADITCRSDGAITPCASPHVQVFPSFPHGDHRFVVEATDALGNTANQIVNFKLDFRAPEVAFGANIPNAFTMPTARYVVEMDIADADADLATLPIFPIMCRWVLPNGPGTWLDTGFGTCSNVAGVCTGTTFSGEGTHFAEFCNPPVFEGPATFAVRLEDEFGNNNASELSDLASPNAAPFTITWVVDGTRPELAWLQTPFDPRTPPATLGDPTTARVSYLVYDFAATNAAYTGTTAREVVSGYFCTWNGPTPLSNTACTPPMIFSDVPPGSYTLSITAVDQAGNQTAAPLIHNVTVVYPPLSQDPCDAGGDMVVATDLTAFQGRNVEQINDRFNVKPLVDYNYQGLVQSLDLTAIYRNSGVTALWLWGGGDHDVDSLNNKAPEAAGVTLNPGCGVVTLNDNTAIDANGDLQSRHKWFYMVGLASSAASFYANERATDRFGLAEFALGDRLIARHRHPPRGSLLVPGVVQQVMLDLDLRTAASQPLAVTLEITARAREGDVLATAVMDLAPLGITASGVDARINASIFVEPPHCAGMFALEVSAVPPRLGVNRQFDRYDEVRIPVQLGGDDKYEPNDSEPTAAGPLTTPVVEPNLNLVNADWFVLQPTADAVAMNIAVRPAVPGTDVWLTLNDDLTAPLLPPTNDAGDVSPGDGSVQLTLPAVDLARTYTLGVTAPPGTFPSCLRYRLTVTQ